MNYRHAFHAGGFADVVKHTVLLQLFYAMQKKTAPYCYIDTHAGEGCYPSSLESPDGVLKLLNSKQTHPAFLQSYLKLMIPTYYPGSPLIAAGLARENDRIILNEKHGATFQKLKQNCRDYPGIAIHQRDAYEFLPAVIPPKESRGVVLIDPAFEDKNEMEQVVQCLRKCAIRWPQGIYLVWIPMVGRSYYAAHDLTHVGFTQWLTIEFAVKTVAIDTPGLIGCSLVMFNPPWQIEETLSPLLEYLWKILHVDVQSQWRLDVHRV